MTVAPSTFPQSSSSLGIGTKAPIMDAFGNPLELPAHISPHQVFELLDQALPFEVCLYHRVLPLALEGDQLSLGMVDPHDEQALEYVGRIASYSDRTLAPVPLAGHLHQVLLSAYLHHSSQPTATQSTAIAEVPQTAIASTGDISESQSIDPKGEVHLADTTLQDATLPKASSSDPDTAAFPPKQANQSKSLEEWELDTLFPTDTIVQAQSFRDLGIPVPARATSTLNIEQPSHLETRPISEAKAEAIAQRQLDPTQTISQRMTLILDETEIMAELAQRSQEKTGEPPTLIENLEQGKGHQDAEQEQRQQQRDIVEEVPCLSDNPALPSRLDSLSKGELSQRDWDGIAHLPPNLILQAILGKMLQGNITRLRMERDRRPETHGDLAQLFWNPAGVLQPVWGNFSLGSFGALAKALRELSQLPLGPILQPIQRGAMRRYQGQPILLLMQFLPGDKITVIELRLLQDQALRDFQKHQGQDLGREALLTAQTLQHQVQQLLDHHQRYPESGEIPAQLATVIGQLTKAIATPITP